MLDSDWPQLPFLEVAKKLGQTYQVRIPTDDTVELKRLVNNADLNPLAKARLANDSLEHLQAQVKAVLNEQRSAKKRTKGSQQTLEEVMGSYLEFAT